MERLETFVELIAQTAADDPTQLLDVGVDDAVDGAIAIPRAARDAVKRSGHVRP